jgi:predicted nucleic acid-binding protein
MKLILVDTSVFIAFLRDGSSKLADLLDQSRVLLSSFVQLELLMGVRASERAELADLLNSIPSTRIESDLFQLARSLLRTVRQRGVNSGLVDYLIVLEALQSNAQLYSFDKTMNKTASLVGVEVFK